MTKEQALECIRWFNGNPILPTDYGKSYKLGQLQEAYKVLGKELPDWLKQVEADNKKWEMIGKTMNSFANNFSRKREEDILKILMGEI